MAISPERVLNVTENEAEKLKEVELKIDRMLIKHYHPGGHVDYPIGKRWRPGFIAALIRNYEQSGWSVTRVLEGESDGWRLRFQPGELARPAQSS